MQVPPRLPNPWGRSTPKLVPSELSKSEREWLVNEVVFHGQTAAFYNKRYGMNKVKILSTWVRRYRKSGVVNVSNGRPCQFDEKEITELKDFISQVSYTVKIIYLNSVFILDECID